MLKHPLYPIIEKYIQDYLHGFTKKQLEIAITKGELKFQYLNLRPDSINKKMDEKNIPLWLKAGFVKKLNIGYSVMNIIGEIPLELKIDGLDIILNPSCKWIFKNINYYKQNSIRSQFFGDFMDFDVKNPLNINFKNKAEEFDISIFKQIKELFKDKTIISHILNIIYEKCYKFYLQKNTPMSIKIKNIHIRFEDDFLINYNDNIALGIRVDNIDIKLGKKGNMKKNSIKINKLDIYWENQAKILIPSDFLYSLYINGQLQESYYTQLQDLKFPNFNYQRNTKFIIENFNSTINFGTKIINNSKNLDIFNIKDKPCILYIQICTNEININIWPELIEICDNFLKFTEKFRVIDKIKDYKPKTKPLFIKDIKDINNNNKINIEINKKRKLLIRNWFYYFLFCKKMQKYASSKNKNPLRIEFLRYFNIFCKREDINDKIEKIEEKTENKSSTNIKINNDLPIRIIPSDNIIENSINKDLKIEKNKKNSFDFFSLGNNNSISKNKTILNNKSVININSFLNEQKRKQFEENRILKQINLLFITDILIKGINVNLYPSLNKDNINYLKLKIINIQTKLLLSKEKFDLNISTKNIEFSPYNKVYGERELLSEESYRKLYQDPQVNNEENATIQNINFLNYINTEFYYNSIINNGQGYGNRMQNINDALSYAENNNKRSRGSSLGSGNRNGYYNIDNINNGYNNNPNRGTYNRYLNTAGNNFYSNYNLNNSNQNIIINNNNNYQNNRYNSIGNNSINNNYYNSRKSRIKMALARKNNYSYIDNLEENPTSNQNNLTKKQRKELDISQAVNNYNSYKIKLRSITPLSLMRPIKNKIIKKKNINEPYSNKNMPLNLLEIYSNSNNNSFSLSFTKYNNPVSFDSFLIKIGTIRTNLFFNYLQECLKIYKEYNKFFNGDLKKNFFEDILNNKILENNKQLFHMKDYFYKNINKLPDVQKTESMIKYGEYLRKEILLMKIFNTKIEDFHLNYLFSIFNNGIKFNFGFENIECVYYSKYKKISGKFIIPNNEFEITINLKKINIKIFGMELEINELEDTKLILKKIKKLFETKLAMAEVMIEPCYIMLKKELNNENELKSNENIYKDEENEKMINKYTIKTNDEIKNIFINSNINTNNKIYFDDNNILMNSLNKDINEDNNKKKNNFKNDNKNSNTNILNENNCYYNEEDKK